MNIHRATNSENAIKIHVNVNETGNADYQIEQHIAELFGQNNGDYFVHSSRIVENFQKNRLFKVFLIEDKENIKHSIFFELIKGSNENKTGPKIFNATSRYV